VGNPSGLVPVAGLGDVSMLGDDAVGIQNS
jgi:hypothetical protein